MKTCVPSKKLLALISLVFCQSTFAYVDTKPWYVSGDFSIFQGNYDLIYNDQTDIIAQNVRQTVQQNGYTAGFALGYSQTVHKDYLLGAEFVANIAANNANFASGSSTTAFSDQIKIQGYLDFVIVPGIYLTDSLAAYIKAGISLGLIKDSINSPTGYAPSYAVTNSNKNMVGAAMGIGMKKFITHQFVVFSEYQYHDYGMLNLPGFQNFTANYSHSAHVYSQAVMLGLSYLF